jgi:hypothetical protein
MPKSRIEYWGPKLERNVRRGVCVQKLLNKAGWTVLVIWECESKKIDLLEAKFLYAGGVNPLREEFFRISETGVAQGPLNSWGVWRVFLIGRGDRCMWAGIFHCTRS